MPGIGEYKERELHKVLKAMYESDPAKREIRYKGYIADIKNENGIYEIQTGSYNQLRVKLSKFLEEDTVTLIYPAVRVKYLVWIDAETGEITKRRKSPKIGTPYAFYAELYKIKQFLTNPNLRLHIVTVDLEEYRKLDGWSENRKKGSSRAERIPLTFGETTEINSLADYIKIIPQSLPSPFTSEDMRREAKLSVKAAQTALNVLYHIGAVERTGKTGRRYKYEARGLRGCGGTETRSL
jgi:hypothetical protein